MHLTANSNSITATVQGLDEEHSEQRKFEWYVDGKFFASSTSEPNISEYEYILSPIYFLSSHRVTVDIFNKDKSILFTTLGGYANTTFVDPPLELWSWINSNGNATDAQTQRAYVTLVSKGQTADMNHEVWNDLMDMINDSLEKTGQRPLNSMDLHLGQYEGLTAAIMNAAVGNTLYPRWTWRDDPNDYDLDEGRSSYLGRLAFQHGDIVFGRYIVELAKNLNSMRKAYSGIGVKHAGMDVNAFLYSWTNLVALLIRSVSADTLIQLGIGANFHSLLAAGARADTNILLQLTDTLASLSIDAASAHLGTQLDIPYPLLTTLPPMPARASTFIQMTPQASVLQLPGQPMVGSLAAALALQGLLEFINRPIGLVVELEAVKLESVQEITNDAAKALVGDGKFRSRFEAALALLIQYKIEHEGIFIVPTVSILSDANSDPMILDITEALDSIGYIHDDNSDLLIGVLPTDTATDGQVLDADSDQMSGETTAATDFSGKLIDDISSILADIIAAHVMTDGNLLDEESRSLEGVEESIHEVRAELLDKLSGILTHTGSQDDVQADADLLDAVSGILTHYLSTAITTRGDILDAVSGVLAHIITAEIVTEGQLTDAISNLLRFAAPTDMVTDGRITGDASDKLSGVETSIVATGGTLSSHVSDSLSGTKDFIGVCNSFLSLLLTGYLAHEGVITTETEGKIDYYQTEPLHGCVGGVPISTSAILSTTREFELVSMRVLSYRMDTEASIGFAYRSSMAAAGIISQGKADINLGLFGANDLRALKSSGDIAVSGTAGIVTMVFSVIGVSQGEFGAKTAAEVVCLPFEAMRHAMILTLKSDFDGSMETERPEYLNQIESLRIIPDTNARLAEVHPTAIPAATRAGTAPYVNAILDNPKVVALSSSGSFCTGTAAELDISEPTEVWYDPVQVSETRLYVRSVAAPAQTGTNVYIGKEGE